ncbi:MAG: hypothetical protein JKY49_18425 [Cohaesibacteraceae bacterium]|nr:hypothetical protein [Cohaesibacteraceae bacterium]
MKQPFWQYSATEILAAMARGDCSSLEVTSSYLERIATYNSRLNAVITIDRNEAIAQAKKADARRANGYTSLLLGLPMTIKDSLCVKGLRCTGGMPEYADYIPDTDAESVARLRQAGAVFIGKSNLPERSGDYQSYNDQFGTTKNPWNPELTPGGSSGGSAAAISAGLSAAEFGSDIAGSIRLPAHFCGIYGLKPSYGLIPTKGHVPGYSEKEAPVDFSVQGPLARSVDDLELLLRATVAPKIHAGWQFCLPEPKTTDTKNLRIVAWLDETAGECDSAMLTALVQSVKSLEQAGAHIDWSARPDFDMDDLFEVFELYIHAIMLADLPGDIKNTIRNDLVNYPDPLSFQNLAARGIDLRFDEHLELAQRKAELQFSISRFFQRYDAILTPVAPIQAFAHDHQPYSGRSLVLNGNTVNYWEPARFFGLASLGYLPAVSAPVGMANGLPVNIQIISGRNQDLTAIAVARAFETVLGPIKHPPGFGFT